MWSILHHCKILKGYDRIYVIFVRSSLLWCTLLRYHVDYLANIKNVWELTESVNTCFDKKKSEYPFVKMKGTKWPIQCTKILFETKKVMLMCIENTNHKLHFRLFNFFVLLFIFVETQLHYFTSLKKMFSWNGEAAITL